MNSQRAQEIAESAKMVNVTYNGEQIYIQHVDESSGTARIYPIEQPDKEMSVPIDSLQEG